MEIQTEISGTATGASSSAAINHAFVGGDRNRDPAIDSPKNLDQLLAYSFAELDLRFDKDLKALWCYQKHRLRPNFTNALINDIKTLQSLLRALFETASFLDDSPIRYLIWASRRLNIFNLGGDLIHFVELLTDRDRAGLEEYARSCVEICFANYMNLNLPITTVALASGDALGGGLESLLSNDIVAVEESAQFGFPEIHFGLFPGMGAYTFVYRRAGSRIADDLVFSGRFVRGKELWDMGLAELVFRDGHGEASLREYLERYERRFSARRSLYDVRRRTEKVTLLEMMGIAEKWVDTALGLDRRDIKRMRLIARAQMAQFKKHDAQPVQTSDRTANRKTAKAGQRAENLFVMSASGAVARSGPGPNLENGEPV